MRTHIKVLLQNKPFSMPAIKRKVLFWAKFSPLGNEEKEVYDRYMGFKCRSKDSLMVVRLKRRYEKKNPK
jgi:hypothetical protein